MTVGFAFVFKTLAFWVGLLLLVGFVWRLASRGARSVRLVAGSLACLILAWILPGLPALGDGRFHVPLFLPIFPAEYLLALPLLVGFLRALFLFLFARKGGFALQGMICGPATLAVVRIAGQSTAKATILGGSLSVSVTACICLALLAVCAIVIMGVVQRRASSKLFLRRFSIYAGLVAGSVVFGLPFLWMLSTSFSDDREINSASGISWIPRIQVTVPFKDPSKPYYKAQSNDQDLEGRILSTAANGDKLLDVVRPIARLGQTVLVPQSLLEQIPEPKPEVFLQTNEGLKKSLDLETLPNGQHRLHIIGTPDSDDVLTNPARLTPVLASGARFQNYPDSLEFLPEDTLHGLVYLKNTLIIVLLSVIGAVFSSSIVAYAFARLSFGGKKLLFALLLSTMMLPTTVTLMPQFMIFRELGWIDTLRPLWVPTFFATAFNVFLLRQFFAGVPLELEEAARIDGCSVPKIFWSVTLPQVIPALVTVAIWTAVAAWNNFAGPLIYINSPENMPVSYAVQLFQGQRSSQPGLLMAFVTLSIIPVIALFLVAQRYFLQNSATSGLGGR